MPVVGDVSKTVGGAASIPGKAVSNAGNVLSRDLPGVSEAVKPVEGPVGNVPDTILQRDAQEELPGGGYGGIPAGDDATNLVHYKRDLPNIPTIPAVP